MPVDTLVCRLTEEAPEGAPAPPTTVTSPTSPAEPPPTPVAPLTDGMRQRMSPAVRRIVRDHGLDVRQIKGTGEGGRITRADVTRYLASRDAPAVASPAAPPPSLEDRVEPFTVMRKRIAEHMTMSVQTAPHASTVHEIDLSAVARLRTELRARWRDRRLKPTYLTFIVQAVARALRECPHLNAAIVGEEVHVKGDINMGIAVALEDGLIVPVIPRADTLSILEVTAALEDLARRARGKMLKPEDVQGGTFTITNPGVFGSLLATPIINQPQVGILCTGAVQKRPVVLPESDAIAIRRMAYFTLTFDHRLVDGALAGRFLASVTKTLETAEFRIEP